MKKVLSIMSLAMLALSGCDSQAQDSVSIDAGNPDSNNLVIMESYEAVVVPGNAAQPQPAMPNNNNNQQQPAANNGNDNQNNGGTAVFENVTDTQTPNAEEVDIDAVAVPEN